jgi:hypothetical protein
MNRLGNWAALDVDNKAKVGTLHKGQLDLSLGHVPAGWPYQYQWSGVTQDFRLDVARYSVLVARVSDLHGYAHLEIEVLDRNGKPKKGLRSNTLQQPGILQADLSTTLDPATYHLRVRLIVGGPNEGCNATYNWIRAVRPEDVSRLTSNPGSQCIVLDQPASRD